MDEVGVDDPLAKIMVAARTLLVWPLLFTLTIPRWLPPSCVKFRIRRKCLSGTEIVSGELVGVMMSLVNAPAKARE
jgi:hypothetical protein